MLIWGRRGSSGWGDARAQLPVHACGDSDVESRMRENRTYGSERGVWAAGVGMLLVRHSGVTLQPSRLKP